MRPLRLDIQAFGPYANHHVIDFRELGERTFFLIHGPTGSGKTSILDAISYALYGEPSGADRPVKHLRSDHASADLPTQVTFEFSIGEERYLVSRSPEQEQLKKRGAGLTTRRYTASLYRLSEATPLDPGALLASQPSRVTEMIEQLLGFQCEQFRQVIMLPQGKFQSFLTGDSRRRQEILDVLFHTAFYRRIEEALKEAARSVRDQAGQWTQRRALILEQAEVSSTEALHELLSEDRRRLGELKGEVERCRAVHLKATEALGAARRIEQKLGELAAARAAEHRIGELERAVQFQEQQHCRGLAAASLNDAEKSQRQRQEEADQAAERLRIAQKALLSSKQREASARERLLRQQDLAGERQVAQTKVDQLQQMVEKVAALTHANLKQDQAKSQEQLTASIAEEARQTVAQLKQKAQQAGEILAEALSASERRNTLKWRVQELGRARTSKKTLAHVQQQLRSARASREALRDQQEPGTQKLAEARQSLEALETAWHKGQAALLAAQLQRGDPCPVCGSLEHPQLALAKGELPSEQTLQRRRKEVEQLAEELQEGTHQISLLTGEIHALEKEEGNFHEGLGEYDAQPVEFIQEQLILAQNQWQQAENQARRVDEFTSAKEALATVLALATTDLQHHEEEHRATSLALAQCEAVVKTRAEEIPFHLREETVLIVAQTAARLELDQLQEALFSAQQEEGRAKESLAHDQTRLQEATLRVTEAATLAQGATQDLTTRLKQAGFADLEDLQHAKRSVAALDALDQEIQTFRATRSAAQDRLQRAEEAARDLLPPDLSAQEAVTARSQQSLEEHLRLEESMAQRVQRTEGWLTDLRDIDARTAALDQKYLIAGRLSEVASGKNTDGLTFQRYVLAARLEQVLFAATERLRQMSRGRFSLSRMQQRADLRAPGGLDMEVYDTFTGTNRPVNTLSGGEIFLASLSLALGLADVVQADSGGIRMDTIFVDEGFGSLDSETLDRALDTLVTLQAGGRLVGIISHVEELKERIGNRLEVTPVRGGSSTRFILD